MRFRVTDEREWSREFDANSAPELARAVRRAVASEGVPARTRLHVLAGERWCNPSASSAVAPTVTWALSTQHAEALFVASARMVEHVGHLSGAGAVVVRELVNAEAGKRRDGFRVVEWDGGSDDD